MNITHLHDSIIGITNFINLILKNINQISKYYLTNIRIII